MATRLYYRTDRYYPKASLYASLWDVPTDIGPFVRGLDTTVQEIAVSAASRSFSSGANPRDIPCAAFFTRPLVAQTISGTLKGRLAASESSHSANLTAQLKAYLVDPDGVIKSTLYGGYTGSAVSEFSTAKQNREFPKGASVALTSQTAVAGDRILIIIGARTYQTNGYAMTLYYGDGESGGTDLPENETATSGNPWLEFSTDLTFLADVTLTDFRELVTDEKDAIWMFGAGGGGAAVPTQGQIWPRGNF